MVEPVIGKTVTTGATTGNVTYTPPGGGTPKPLEAGDALPVGTLIDATNGTITLTSAGSTPGSTQTAQFKEGQFRIEQGKKSSLTTLKLAGPLYGCSSSRVARTASAKAHPAGRRRGRTLWGKGHGRFRTSGSAGSGSVRGTTWRVTDRCDGSTVVTSIEGTVWAMESKWGPKGPIWVLKTGKSHYAKPSNRR